ncbi:uncharacterized protein Z518_00220 [Rhinocladiella mackenziei CBS 650.93]|uniref:Aminoglycoside phosphotransferase domain-containing protein n=1 Tax=Rhinocladiella mackenziei CBS 650.93 TaxID=1442369 RepID=A0A0D2G3I4_9EURO|nr:uncharacterized protein Z518_00220 [Rhinocladiella mackenziei CBS 650.93]KIX09142.1 hypothetical protein Z518_00220 [Rhinocladiella mackenziei CBS 650.93]
MAASDDYQLTLPYFGEVLPCPLPTQEQIDNADQILVEVGGRKVYGEAAEELEVEAATVIFLRNTTRINLPKVYAVYRLGDHGAVVIVMEFIPGSNLLEAWPRLSAAHKQQVCLDLKQQIDQLRNLPSLGYFGGVGKRPMPDGIFWTGEGDERSPGANGPFYSENELNNALVGKTLLVDKTWNGRGPQRSQFYKRMLPDVLRNHASVFTHADLQRKNIIIQSSSGSEVSLTISGDFDHLQAADLRVALVDWEKAGWYPSYWEYCAASWAFRFDDDWPEYLETVLDPWPAEYAWLHILRNELWS